MAYNILFTSLYAAGKDEPVRYYYANVGNRRVYTDAMLTVEATTKYILSCIEIDEILVLGRQLTFDAGDDERVLGVDDGKVFYSSDIRELSTYSLFRYRLAQFIDDLKIDQQEITDLLSPEEQKKTESFIRDFFNRVDEDNEHKKFGRFFDKLVQNAELYERMKREILEAIPEAADRPGLYMSWIKNYLYSNLKDSSRIEILEGNEDATVRFVPTMVDETGKPPIDSIINIVKEIAATDHDNVNIYFAMTNDDMTDNLVLLGVLDILDTLYGSRIEIPRVYTATNAHYRLAGMIKEDTDGYGMAPLMTATRAFLKYGKADMIVDYWEHSRSKNSQVEKMIYAMRRIDTGLSLCNIGDIEKGIADLRELFRNGFDLSDSDYYSKLFILMSEGIKKDYGRLVTDDDAGFIDLVKWAYSKGFYQQCLTLIEAKAPTDMVSRGMFYYCNDENNKERVTELFARERNQLKSFEQWKMADLDHYFIKTHIYFKLPSNNIQNQRENAKYMMSYMDNTDPDIITAYTLCDDRQVLEDLIFAYFHVSRIRNETNHAKDAFDDNGTLFPDDKDISSKLVEIQESIRYFIQSFDTMLEQLEGKELNVVRIDGEVVRAEARRLEKSERYGDRKDDRNRDRGKDNRSD